MEEEEKEDEEDEEDEQDEDEQDDHERVMNWAVTGGYGQARAQIKLWDTCSMPSTLHSYLKNLTTRPFLC